MKYIFILGREAPLCLSEIFSLFKKNRKEFKITAWGGSFCVIDSPEKIEAASLMQQLGGTIKIAAVEALIQFPANWTPENLMEKLLKDLLDLIKNKNWENKKIFFGLSAYQDKTLPKPILTEKTVSKLGLIIKAELSQAGLKSRLVASRDKVLSSVTVKMNKLLSSRGMEIILAFEKDKIWLGRTLVVQPFAEFSERDYGRPGRDSFSGLLPPKLARIMINLAEVPATSALLDPFCGSGTIVTEAWLMGYRNILGSDINFKAVEDTKKNIEWVKKKNSDVKNRSDIKIFRENVAEISKKIPLSTIEAIVSEPFLGPPLTGRESEKEINNLVQRLSALYRQSLKEFGKILKTDGRIIMILPVFRQKIFIPLLAETKKMDLEIIPLLPKEYEKSLTPRKTLIYARPDQKTGREIVKLKKTGLALS